MQHITYSFLNPVYIESQPPSPFSMLYRKEANSRDRKSNIEKGGGGSIVEMRKEICLKYSNMTKCLNTFVAHCLRRLTCFCSSNRCCTYLKCRPSLYSRIWVLFMGKLWQAYSLVQKFKEIINFFGSVILRDTRA